MAFQAAKLAVVLMVTLHGTAFDVKKARRSLSSFDPEIFIMKKSMLVGMSEQVEEVCETVVLKNFAPIEGHMVNGSRVEIMQRVPNLFRRTYVHCKRDGRPPCNGIKDNLYISECVTVYENVNTFVRLINTPGPFALGTIRVPIQCECRLRRQYQNFERPQDDLE